MITRLHRLSHPTGSLLYTTMLLFAACTLCAQSPTTVYSASRLCTESGKRDGGIVTIELIKDGLAGARTYHFALTVTSHEEDQMPDGEDIPTTSGTEMSFAQMDSVVQAMKTCKDYTQQYDNRRTTIRNVADVMVGTGVDMHDHRIIYIFKVYETAVLMDAGEFDKVSGMLAQALAQGKR